MNGFQNTFAPSVESLLHHCSLFPQNLQATWCYVKCFIRHNEPLIPSTPCMLSLPSPTSTLPPSHPPPPRKPSVLKTLHDLQSKKNRQNVNPDAVILSPGTSTHLEYTLPHPGKDPNLGLRAPRQLLPAGLTFAFTVSVFPFPISKLVQT